MAPLSRKLTHDAAHAYARKLAQRLARTDPDRYVTSASLPRRPGRLFIDYLRNGRGTTAVGAYSPRVRQGFPIAAPVTWKQVERGIVRMPLRSIIPSEVVGIGGQRQHQQTANHDLP
jgi:bifunctional non-homologous end joining protein LigD